MNILLWVLQIFLALHTAIGAVWKFSNSEQTVPSLSAIPHAIWLSMSVFEIVCAIGLIIPVILKRLSIVTPIAALCIAAEMLAFCILSSFSGEINFGQIIYWIVVAAICVFIAYGRLVLVGKS